MQCTETEEGSSNLNQAANFSFVVCKATNSKLAQRCQSAQSAKNAELRILYIYNLSLAPSEKFFLVYFVVQFELFR